MFLSQRDPVLKFIKTAFAKHYHYFVYIPQYIGVTWLIKKQQQKVSFNNNVINLVTYFKNSNN